MPCDSSHLNPNSRESESRIVCELLEYVCMSLGRVPPDGVQEGLQSIYGNVQKLDEHTRALCDLCRGMSDPAKELVIYNGRNPKARKLADWWDKHQAADAKKGAK